MSQSKNALTLVDPPMIDATNDYGHNNHEDSNNNNSNTIEYSESANSHSDNRKSVENIREASPQADHGVAAGTIVDQIFEAEGTLTARVPGSLHADKLQEGDSVILFAGYGQMSFIDRLRNGSIAGMKLGNFHHQDIIGQRFGTKVLKEV